MSTHQIVADDVLDVWAAEQVCPACGTVGLRIEHRLVANTNRNYSLAGVQDKVTAVETPFVVCGCGLEKQGKRP